MRGERVREGGKERLLTGRITGHFPKAAYYVLGFG